MIIDLKLHRLEQMAEEYARSRTRRERPVSVAAAIRAIRTVMPDVDVEDRRIAELVAAKAIDHGLAVDFDLEGRGG